MSMMNDLDRLAVRAAPDLMADLMVRRYDDTRALTNYAIEHGVELPAGYTPEWDITPVFDNAGNELGLYWDDPNDGPQAV